MTELNVILNSNITRQLEIFRNRERGRKKEEGNEEPPKPPSLSTPLERLGYHSRSGGDAEAEGR